MAYSAFYTGLTGLKAHSAQLNVIGNNLANVNTFGFKGSRASFAELFSSTTAGVNGAGVPFQIGLGTQLAAVHQIFNQGALQPTDVETDMALQGSGLFALRTHDGLPVYSRAGNFSFDANGYLVDPNGHRVQGYTELDPLGHIIPSGSISDIRIPAGLQAPPNTTTLFELTMNLNAEALVDNPATAANEAEMYTNTVPVFDSLGAEHELTLVFTPIDNDGDGKLDDWTWEARAPKSDLGIPVAPGDPEYEVIDSGTMQFDSNGQLTDPAANVTLSIPGWANGAAAQDVVWGLFETDATPLVTGFAMDSAISSMSQNGYGVGRIRTLTVNDAGLISGTFTNGQTIELAQLAIASFNNPAGLTKAAGNTYTASLGSGAATLGTAGTGGRGTIMARALELSNVDITDQFTDLIIAERGYQSNSRIITTTDQVMQEALSIKRG
ncbi:MAG: flagellar hook protein FlgE [Acidobacteria bacterium]|nr:flagellar hook protein FlgE [Acidobacteriota bacterium]